MTVMAAIGKISSLLYEDDDIMSQDNLFEAQYLTSQIIETLEKINKTKHIKYFKNLEDVLYEDDDIISQDNLFKAQKLITQIQNKLCKKENK